MKSVASEFVPWNALKKGIQKVCAKFIFLFKKVFKVVTK